MTYRYIAQRAVFCLFAMRMHLLVFNDLHCKNFNVNVTTSVIIFKSRF